MQLLSHIFDKAAIKAFVGEHGGACCTSSNAHRVFEWALKGGDTPLAPIGETTLRYLGAGDHVAQIYERRTLCAGDVINGPAIVREPLSTTHIGQGQVGTIGRHGEIVITQV